MGGALPEALSDRAVADHYRLRLGFRDEALFRRFARLIEAMDVLWRRRKIEEMRRRADAARASRGRGPRDHDFPHED